MAPAAAPRPSRDRAPCPCRYAPGEWRNGRGRARMGRGSHRPTGRAWGPLSGGPAPGRPLSAMRGVHARSGSPSRSLSCMHATHARPHGWSSAGRWPRCGVITHAPSACVTGRRAICPDRYASDEWMTPNGASDRSAHAPDAWMTRIGSSGPSPHAPDEWMQPIDPAEPARPSRGGRGTAVRSLRRRSPQDEAGAAGRWQTEARAARTRGVSRGLGQAGVGFGVGPAPDALAGADHSSAPDTRADAIDSTVSVILLCV
jgi:hypothetical protein